MSGATRRSLLRSLAFLGVGVGAAWWLRERYLFPRPDVAFAGGRTDTGWLPLPDTGGLVELTAHVGGQAVRVVVDSGAQFSAIDRNLAAQLGLKPAMLPLLAFGVSGAPTVTHTVDLDLSIGPLLLKGVRAATLELVTLSGVIRRPFSMLIGRDVLRALVADIDWPTSRVRFVQPGAFRPPADATVARVQTRGGALMTPIRIEGSAPVDVMIDTGATSDLALSEKTATELGLLNGRHVTSGRSVSLGGMSEDRVVRARSVEFSGRQIPDVEVQVFSPTHPAPLPAGLLGVGLLKRYRVALDLGAGVMWLTLAPLRLVPPPRPRATLAQP